LGAGAPSLNARDGAGRTATDHQDIDLGGDAVIRSICRLRNGHIARTGDGNAGGRVLEKGAAVGVWGYSCLSQIS
jgi:hypothetical protein